MRATLTGDAASTLLGVGEGERREQYPSDFHVTVVRQPRYPCTWCNERAFTLAEPARGDALGACDRHLPVLLERIAVELGIPKEAARAGREAVEAWQR